MTFHQSYFPNPATYGCTNLEYQPPPVPKPLYVLCQNGPQHFSNSSNFYKNCTLGFTHVEGDLIKEMLNMLSRVGKFKKKHQVSFEVFERLVFANFHVCPN